jgi:hypothetical protein
MNRVTFSCFADFHYYPGVFYCEGEERLQKIIDRAKENKADFILHLGDFCSTPLQSESLIRAYNTCGIPAYHVLGNHDADLCTKEEAVTAYGMPHNYYYFDIHGFRFIVFDPNYCLVDGEYVPYSKGNYFKTPTCRDYVPGNQITWLGEIIFSSPYPCILLSHSSLERTRNGIRNRDKILSMIKEANREKRKVIMCINGHYHRDFIRIWDNVVYYDVNSATMDWLENPHHDLFPPDYYAKYKRMGNLVVFNDPVHPIITLSEDGTVDIKGMESSFLCGISREMTDNSPTDAADRPCEPRVGSARFKIPL